MPNVKSLTRKVTMNLTTTDFSEQERELEQRLADLQKRLPKHSVPVSMMVELEELEEALAAIRRQAGQSEKQHAASHR